MWIRKTEEEIKNPKIEEEYIAGIRVTPLNLALLIFTFLMILEIAGDLIFGKSKGRFYLPVEYAREKVTLSELPSMLPGYFVVASCSAIIFYILVRQIMKSKMRPNTYICQKCYNVKSADKNYKCECGGEYIEIDKMKWVEDKKKQ